MNDCRKKELNDLIIRKYSNITGLMVSKNEQIVFESYYRGFGMKDTFHVASVTKSILSGLIGIAIDRGKIKNIDQKVLDFFPEYRIKRRETTIQNVTLRHLLTMTAPYKFKSEPYTKVYSSDDWTLSALDLLGGKNEIGEFKYTTVGIQILSGVLENATGQYVSDFASDNLFVPLEIKPPKSVKILDRQDYFKFIKNGNVSGWASDPRGVNTAGWGLALSVRDMMKIGRLYLNNGKYKENQLISSEWIEKSTEVQSKFNDLSYGYLWWVLNDRCYAAIGDGGNIIYVSRERNVVVTITSTFMPRAKDRLELIHTILNYI